MPPPATTRAPAAPKADWSLAWLVTITLMGAGVGLAPARSATPHDPVPPHPPHPHHVSSPLSPTTARCQDCHTVAEGFSHPVGVVPSMPIPDDLPLDDGRLACITCHTPDPAAHDEAARDHSPLIRGSLAPAGLCARCHVKSMADGPAAHASPAIRAHLHWPELATGTTAIPHAQPRLDDETLSCLECHDGSLASDAGGHAAPPGRFDLAFGSDHPVGVPLEPVISASRRDTGPLADPESLDPRVRLFGGMVGCGSCHSVYSPIEHDLVMSNHKSRLCLECHTY